MAIVDAPPTTADHGPADALAAAALALARRFAAGATMWCVAPGWPSHGRHAAVEFVHPVIVGKRALPAAGVEGSDAAKSVRLLARPGDVLMAIGTADDDDVVDLMSRAEAWGLTRLWLGAGPRPGSGHADHVVWLDDADPAVAARSGDMVLLYHLLWELTQVVLEHPGLLLPQPARPGEVCITCSDEGQIGEVRSILEGSRAEVVVNGLRQSIDTSLVDAVAPGDLLLVHAGVALTTMPGIRR